MKGNDGSGNNTDRDSWRTPDKLFKRLDERYNFDFDCCASAENAKCYSWTDNFLSCEPYGLLHRTAWMNPPFSKAKEMFEHFFQVVDNGMAIYRCDNMETSIWQDVILPNCNWVHLLKSRVQYVNPLEPGKKQARFPSALIGCSIPTPFNIEGHALRAILW